VRGIAASKAIVRATNRRESTIGTHGGTVKGNSAPLMSRAKLLILGAPPMPGSSPRQPRLLVPWGPASTQALATRPH
jgi:hypothetical protein